MLSAPGHGRTGLATHSGMSDLEALNKNILLVRGSVAPLSSDCAVSIATGRAKLLTFVSSRLVVACAWDL